MRQKKVEISIFTIFYLIGIVLVPTYGIGWDEYGGRAHGTYNLVGVVRFINPGWLPSQYSYFPTLDEWYAFTHGAWFEMFLSLFEPIFGLEDMRSIYLLRHFLTYSFCFAGLVSFYLFIARHFKHNFYPWLAVLLAVLSPRQFGDSFYNSKDAVFMASSAILMNLLSLYFSNTTRKRLILIAIASGFYAGIRIAGIVVVPFTVCAIIVRYYLSSKLYSKSRVLLDSFLYLTISFASLIFSMPYLWPQPISRIIRVIKANRNFDWAGNTLFNGQLTSAFEVPPSYLPFWFSISTPLHVVLLFALSLPISIIYLKVSRRRLDSIETSFIYTFAIFIAYSCFLFLAVILSRSTLYSGWRHFYFVYPVILTFVLVNVRLLALLLSSHAIVRFLLFSALLLSMLNTGGWMIRNHPMHNLYFNAFAGNQPVVHWDMDYWGLGNLAALRWVLSHDSRSVISVSPLSNTPLFHSDKLLKEEEKKRLRFLDSTKPSPDYYITNFFGDSAPKLNREVDGYKLVKSFYIDESIYLQIYERK